MTFKERLTSLLDSKKEQREALNGQLIASDSKEERAAIGETLRALANEIGEVEKLLADADKPAEGQPEGAAEGERFKVSEAYEMRNGKAETPEARAEAFARSNRMTLTNKEARAALTVAGGKVAQPVGVDGINGLFPGVSSIVDLVKIVDASGMGGGYKVAYQVTDSAASTKTEGATAATESEPTFDILTITASDRALVSYISNKVRKQSPLTYEDKVRESAMTALRKFASAAIVDALKASTITEIYNIPTTGSTTKTGVLGADFLRKITLLYGGDEAVAGSAVLMLNKADLIALGDIRGTNEKKPVFDIEPDAQNPNTGIIKDGGLAVRYIINSNCAALSGTTQTTADIKGIFYGNPKAIELALFSDYEVRTSEDYKFAEDMLAIRGTVSLGAGMAVYKGFVVAQLPKTGA